MLLTVDVGNTNITLGLFKEDKVFATFRMNTQMVKTSDEYGSTIAELIARKNININEIEDVIISSVVQSGDKAMAAAPFVLIVQLLFSGILFTLKGAGKIISYCTVSRWSVEALGSIARLNKLDLRMQADFPMLEHEAESFFKATAGHVWTASGILILMTAVLMVVATLLLRNVAKDRR